jgi:mRNA interferase MazF
MVIRQGDIYWLDMGAPSGSGRGYRHPHVVIQNDLFCASKSNTVIVCEITSNLTRAEVPGNVHLEKGEGGLPKESVVNVSRIFTVDKRDLIELIGSLPSERLQNVLEGLSLWLQPRPAPRGI